MSLVSGPQYGVPFTLEGPDGAKAVFNDETSPFYAGMLVPDECSGLEGAEVRENLVDRTEQDGAIQGAQFYGKRPVVLTGIINSTTTTQRNEMLARIKRASNAMRKDASLTWTPDGGEQMFTRLRRQQRLAISGGWMKKFQISLVAADPRLYSTALTSASVLAAPAAENGRSYDKNFNMSYGAAVPTGILNVTNQGDGESPPVIRIYGPGTNPSVINNTTGQIINLTFTLFTAEEYLELDFFSRTIKLNGQDNRYSAFNFETSEWWYLQPDANEIRLAWSSFTAGAKMEILYRAAWF